MRTVLPLLLAALLPAAALAAPGQEQPLKVSLTARLVPPDQRAGPEPPYASVSGGARQVAVSGRMETPVPCYDLGGEVRRHERVITLTVNARRRKDVGCIAVIAAFDYSATVGDVPPGRYTVRVVHTYPETGWATRTITESSVQVR